MPGPAVLPGHRRFDGKVAGHQRPRRRSTTRQYGPGRLHARSSRSPTGRFRLMIGLGMLAAADRRCSALWADPREGRLPAERALAAARWPSRLPLLPLLANSFGWIFTEMGRQPWVVFGAADAPPTASPRRQRREVLTSLIVLHRCSTRVLAVVEVGLLLTLRQGAGRRARRRPPTPTTGDPTTPTGRSPSPTEQEHRPWNCTTVWFVLIAVLWTGYFVLEGFDFGVGMLLPVLGRDDTERRVLINTIGPVWDGNEVWLLVAGGATFAAFPEWYATLFSGFYLPLLLILVGADRARRRLRVPRQARRRRPGGAAGTRAIFVGSLRAGAAVGRRVRATSCAACRSTPTTSTSAASSTCSTRTRCSAGWPRCRCSSSTARCSWRSRPTATIRRPGRARLARAARAGRRRASRWPFLVWTQLAHRRRPASAVAVRRGRRRPGRRRWSRPGAAARAGRSSAPASTIALAVATLFLALFPDVHAVLASTAACSLTDDERRRPRPYTLKIMTWVRGDRSPRSCCSTRAGPTGCSAGGSASSTSRRAVPGRPAATPRR